MSGGEVLALLEKEKAEELSLLVNKFEVNLDQSGKTTDIELFKALLNSDPTAYFTYKNSSNVERTLIKNRLKARKESDGGELKYVEVMRLHE